VLPIFEIEFCRGKVN